MRSDYLREIEQAFKKTLNQLYNGKTTSNSMLTVIGKTLSQQVQSSYGNITPDWTTPDTEMLMRLTRDVWQFSAAKNYQQMRDLTLALKDENGKLREWDDFKDAAEQLNEKYNVRWMRSEYDNAIAGATSAARWTDFEKNEETMPNLQYQTVGDSSVRESHQVLNGIVRPMKDSFWNVNYPPNGWGCRCEALQVPTGIAPVTPKENIPNSTVPAMFRTNLAKQGLIFPKGHPYYTGIPQSELRKSILYLPPENTYMNVYIDNHSIDIHPLHGEHELGKNIDAVNTLLKVEPEAKIKLLPIIEDKDFAIKHKFYPKSYLEKFPKRNADILYNGMVAEIEIPNGSKTSIQNAIKHGKQQAEFVIINLNEITIDAEATVRGQLKHYQGKENLEVWLIDGRSKRVFETKKE